MHEIRFKIIVGYTILVVMLVSAIWMTYSNTQSLTEVNNTSEQLVRRRDIVDSLVCSLLEASNAERSILLGEGSRWHSFDKALSDAEASIDYLRHLSSDSSKVHKLDSLTMLLDAKRKNTLLVMEAISNNVSDEYFDAKLKALENGSDSVVIYTKEKDESHKTETTMEIVKNRRGFFRRLADAFRKQYADTINTKHFACGSKPDSITHHVDISDSVAQVLTQIRHEELRTAKRKLAIVEQRRRRLQMVSIQMAQRTSQLLEDIQADEHNALCLAIEKAVQSRQDTIRKIATFGLFAFLSAVVLLLLVLRDIRRERRDRQYIVDAKAETERIMQQREQLLLTITHDIKAPAASITGFADLLAESVDNHKAAGYVGNIANSARHLLQLVEALLDYHKLDSHSVEIHAVSFSPACLINEVVSELMPLAQEKGLYINTNVGNAARKAYKGDAFRIRQILTNLITNALKYTDEGGVTIDLVINNNIMAMTVADTGCGMAADELQQIFKPFVRLANSNGKSGTGLGLAITQQLVQMLGGKINVQSAKDKGTTFSVCLPISDATDNDEENRDSQLQTICNKHADLKVNSEQEIKIVIVDDDQLQLQLLAEMFSQLQGAKFAVSSASDAAVAIELVHTIHPQLLLSDIEMPGVTGSQLLQCIKGEDTIKVAMTAHEKSIMASLRSQGFTDCLFKPFSISNLADTLSRLLGIDIQPLRSQPLASLLAFADGDKDAEMNIKTDLRKAIEEYISMIGCGGDTSLLAKAAHKAMPVLELIYPGQNEWLRPITPEHIDETTEADRAEKAKRLKTVLEECLTLTYE